MTLTESAMENAAQHIKTPTTRERWKDAVKKELWDMGEATVDAIYNSAGNCTICGEAGQCPGVHATSERMP